MDKVPRPDGTGSACTRVPGRTPRRRSTGGQAASFTLLALWASAALGLLGCAPVRPTIKAEYLVAVRYDVEPVLAEAGRRAGIETLRRDFQRVGELGFTDVVLRHVDDADRLEVLSIAAETGLRVAVPQRSFGYYAVTGRLPTGCTDEQELARSMPGAVTEHASFATVVVDRVSDDRARQRGAVLCGLLQQRGVPGVMIGDQGSDGTAGALATIDASAIEVDRHTSLFERWLAQFHEGLLAGRTGGLVFDRYRRPPGDPCGLVNRGVHPGPSDLAAIKQVVDRARRWGPALHRTVPAPIMNAAVDIDGLALTAFLRGNRRFVLAFNRSAEGYARGGVLLPEAIGGKEIARAVEVPPTRSKVAGRVIEAQDERITLPVALRPGDAALFEIF